MFAELSEAVLKVALWWMVKRLKNQVSLQKGAQAPKLLMGMSVQTLPYLEWYSKAGVDLSCCTDGMQC